MTQTHPITPPPELIEQWQDESPETQIADHVQYLATQAAQWGADQELEACYGWVEGSISTPEAAELRAARRPKPPSLKQQALLAIDTAVADGCLSADVSNIVRRALESTND